ncbi:MAG: hypothetical protein LH472_00655 [Pyrinomonadaceae bacterium]|nr:hypothetical protein [Pyrinomonadaceae bacterium]
MKYAVIRKSIAAQPPKRKLDQAKVVENIKNTAKKTADKNSPKSPEKTPFKNVKIVAEKNTPPVLKSKTAKKAVKAAPKTVVKVINLPTQKVKSVTAKIADARKTIAPVKQAKTAKTLVVVRKPTTKNNGKTDLKPIRKIAALPIVKLNARKTPPQTFVKKSVKQVPPPKIKTAKVQISEIKVKPKKNVEPKAELSVAVKKSKPIGAVKTTANVEKKLKPTVPVKKIIEKLSKVKSAKIKAATAEKINQTPKKVEPKTFKKAVKPGTEKIKTTVAPKNVKAKPPKTNAPVKKSKVIAVEIEAVSLPLPKPKKKKAKPIGAAIFRGKKDRYDFQVFPVDGEFEDSPAIFIISKRKVDKHQRAHHTMVCIGQTTSVLSELKKHRKGKCFKQHQANAISVLREENEQKRLKIESDLKSAHTIPCPHT